MPIVKVKGKYQVTLPSSVRDQVGIAVGDILEATVENGRITLTPKSIVGREIAKGSRRLQEGSLYRSVRDC